MKACWLILSVSLLFPAVLADEASSQTNLPANTLESWAKAQSEMVSGQVIRVYSAGDADTRFRAYVVRWKDQEVVVSDWVADSDYKEGTTISFSAINAPSPRQDSSSRLLSFLVVHPVPMNPPSEATLEMLRTAMSVITGKQKHSQADMEKLTAMTETVDAPVAKVYAARDGDACFQAYVVKWNGQEVVVDDPLVKTDYHEGDTITFLAMRLPSVSSESSSRMLRLIIQPSIEIHLPSPPQLPVTPDQMPDVAKMTRAILDQLNESWRKRDVAQLKQRIELQCSATPGFVPALLAKAVYVSLIDGDSRTSIELLSRVDDLTKAQPPKSYGKFRDTLGYAEKSVSGLQEKDSRSQALFMIFRDRFPLAKAINNIGLELSAAQTAH